MSTTTAWGMVAGLGVGLGLWCLISMVPKFGRAGLAARIAPHLVDVSSAARELVAHRPSSPVPIIGVLVGPVFDRARNLLAQLLGGTATLRLRLRQSGSSLTVEEFRSRQVLWGLAGTAAGCSGAITAWQTQSIGTPGVLGITLLGFACGVVVRDQLLQRAAKARLARMTSELTTVLEFLTLSLSAGESTLDAFRRIARTSRGELAREFGAVVASVHSGIGLPDALRSLSSELQLAPLTRFIDQVLGAMERGTPLAEVLRAQAQDARDESKRLLLELAGKKEVTMLLPLVFLILPVTILFAVYPGVVVLQLDF